MLQTCPALIIKKTCQFNTHVMYTTLQKSRSCWSH